MALFGAVYAVASVIGPLIGGLFSGEALVHDRICRYLTHMVARSCFLAVRSLSVTLCLLINSSCSDGAFVRGT